MAIAGTSPETATTVLTGQALQVGKYTVNAQVALEGLRRRHCLVPRSRRWHTDAGTPHGWHACCSETVPTHVRIATLPLVFGVSIETAGSVSLACWQEDVAGVNPVATSASLVAQRVANLTQN